MKQAYFYTEPRLFMSPLYRFLVRLLTFFSYTFLLTLVIIFISSEERPLVAVALFIGLFLLERLVHLGQSEYKISHLDIHQKKAVTKRFYNIASYTPRATYQLIETAFTKTTALGGDFYLQLLRQLAQDASIERVLIRLDIAPREFLAKIAERLTAHEEEKIDSSKVYAELEILMRKAFEIAVAEYGEMVLPRDIFGALAQTHDPELEKLFDLFDIEEEDLQAAFLFAHKRVLHTGLFAQKRYRGRIRVMNRAWTARPTPFLDRYSEDITSRVRVGDGGFLIGHTKEYARVLAVLNRPGASRALLVGEVGSGKSAIIDHLAFAVTKDHVGAPLFDKRLVSLSVSSLVAGVSEVEAQERISRVLEEISRAGNIILYIPDIHTLLKTGGRERLSGIDILLPAIMAGDFSVIGSTTPSEYAHNIESRSEFSRAFEVVRITELSVADAMRYLVYAALSLELRLKVTITFGAIKEAVRIAHTHFHETLLPASAEDLLKEAAANVETKHIVRADDVISVAQSKKNIVLRGADKDEADHLLHLEKTIHERFIDQEGAVTAVANALREYRSGLARTGGPIASFLFVGPTGVGKTELAKLLSEIQFGSVSAMVRLDMSEYQDGGSLSRLLGSSDGAILGSLTEKIRLTPYSLILLDEFEKAHTDILNIFLQVLDDGRLTDGLQRVIDFSNTIIIATSNAHATLIQEYIAAHKSTDEIAQMVRGRLTELFKPELINRFSDVIVFKGLSQEDMVRVARLSITELCKAMRENQGVELVFEESAVLAVARLGYDPLYGARPLRRVLSDRIRSVLAEKILRGEIVRGGTIRVLYRDEAFLME